MTEAQKPEIPLHTKWGIRISGVVILLITVLIIRNCIGSFMYGTSTDQGQQNQFYELGYSHGIRKAQGLGKPSPPETKNLLLQKMYRKGFRDGWDSVQEGESKPESPGQPGTESR